LNGKFNKIEAKKSYNKLEHFGESEEKNREKKKKEETAGTNCVISKWQAIHFASHNNNAQRRG